MTRRRANRWSVHALGNGETAPLDRTDPIKGASPSVDFDVHTTRALGKASQGGRVMASGVFALLSLAFLPWQWAAAWFAAVLVWEGITPFFLDGYVVRQPQQRAITAYAVSNFLGGSLFY